MITLHGKLTAEDLIKLQYSTLASNTFIRIFYITVLVLLILSFVMNSILGKFDISTLLIILILPLIIFVYLPWQIRRTFSQNKILQADNQVTYSSERAVVL